MNPDVKGKWVTALRSGNYDQGKGQLAYNNTYCCLGVLCELAVQEGVTLRLNPEHDYDVVRYGIEIYILPIEVMEWAGLTKQDPSFTIPHNPEGIIEGEVEVWLSHLNDSDFEFEEIAAYIEKHF